MFWKKYNVFALFLFSFFLSCKGSTIEYPILKNFIVIDIRDNGVCPVPILVKPDYWQLFKDQQIWYSNPMFGVFGEHETVDPPWKTMMVKNCRLYIGSYGVTQYQTIPVKIDVLHLVSGREAHFDGELTPFYRKDIPQCPKVILGNDKGWKQWQACGKAVEPLVTMTLELQDPVSEFDWEDIFLNEMYCEQIPE